MAGYTRQSVIADGDDIDASLFNNEYNQVLAVFNNQTGHKHDGTTAEGPVIGLIGDAGVVTPLNKVLVDTANDNIGFWVDVASSSVEQVIIQDGAILPVTDDDIDLGSASKEFKNAYFDGTVTADALVLVSGATVTAILDEDTLVTNSDTALATQQSIKAYVDAQLIAANSLSGALAVGNTTGAYDIVVNSGQAITTNTINETTAASGVTIDGVLIKDGLVDGVDVSAIATESLASTLAIGNSTSGNNIIVTAGDVITVDTINETTAASGVTIDGLLIKDGVIAASGVTGTALVASAIGTTVQAYDADLTTWAGVTPGTGVATALAVNIGSAGAPVLFDGALGTPSSGTLTNATGLPAAGVVGTAAVLGANTFTGAQNYADNQLQRPILVDYAELTNDIGSTGGGTQDIDLTLGNSVTATVDTSANTFTFSNPTASDEGCGFILKLTNGGSQTVNWPASVDWNAATAPELTASGVDILAFYTWDGGTTWYGFVLGQAMA